MQTIRLIHWKAEEAKERAGRIEALGYQVNGRLPAGRAFLKELAQDPPQAIVIDLSRLPSQGRDMGVQIRRQASTRGVPLVFVGGQAAKVAAIRDLLPDATYTSWEDLAKALTAAIASPARNPIVPDSAFAAYAGKPLVDKLGIEPGFAVALVNAPGDFETTLGRLPDGVRLLTGAGEPCDLTVYFVSSRQDLDAGLPEILGQAQHGPVWIAWPKKSSGLASDLSQQLVRDTGLDAGLVDYKICAIDSTWSALLFTIRKAT